MYYLQSRYYDPEVGRFLNADAFAATGQGVLGNNMFAYCENNPVNYTDATGYLTDGQIHDEVLEEIAKQSGYRYKYRRQDTLIIYEVAWGFSWFGFCDLYDPITGETWELKKNTASRTCRTEYAQLQLSNYIDNGYLAINPGLDLKQPTTYIPPRKFTVMDKTGTQYLISYWDQGGGILRYQYFVIPSNYDVVACTVIAGAFCVGVSIQRGGNTRIQQNLIDR